MATACEFLNCDSVYSPTYRFASFSFLPFAKLIQKRWCSVSSLRVAFMLNSKSVSTIGPFNQIGSYFRPNTSPMSEPLMTLQTFSCWFFAWMHYRKQALASWACRVLIFIGGHTLRISKIYCWDSCDPSFWANFKTPSFMCMSVSRKWSLEQVPWSSNCKCRWLRFRISTILHNLFYPHVNICTFS